MDGAFAFRRPETLSDTIFGIAMTLVVHDVPAAGRLVAPLRCGLISAATPIASKSPIRAG
jgi:hypothetical protein